MKKLYYVIAGLTCIVTAAIAADEPERNGSSVAYYTPSSAAATSSASSAPPLPSAASSGAEDTKFDMVDSDYSRKIVVPNVVDARAILKTFADDPKNFESKGGIGFGILAETAPKMTSVGELFTMMTQHFNELRAQLLIAKAGLENVDAVRKALKEAQAQREHEAEERKKLEDRLRASEARNNLLISDRESLLLETNKKDAALILEAERKRFLEAENIELRRIIAEFEANAKQEAELLSANQDHERSLQKLTGEPSEIARTRESISRVMDENREKIRALQARNKILEQLEATTRAKIKKLEQAIEANDYYSIILKKIRDERVSDQDLALYIWSVATIVGNLDQLSEGRDIRLIEALINVSKPEGNRPLGHTGYQDCFRHLGSLFVPGGLAWRGNPIDINACRYVGSQFQQNAASLAAIAKSKLGGMK